MSDITPSIALRIAWTNADIWPAGLRVLLALASCGDWETGQWCYPSVETIVARSGLSRATVTRTLKRLRAEGWITVRAWRRRHATTYDINIDRLATHPPRAQQVSMTALLTSDLEAQNEPSTYEVGKLEAQNEPQGSELEAQNEPPICSKDLDQERTYTHTPRAREDAPPDPDLALLGPTPPPRCAHPHKHAWCAGRVHVPRDLHFEFLDRLGAVPGETRSEKAGRLIAFYADTMTHLPAEADIANAYTFWTAAYQAWLTTGARKRAEARRPDGVVSGSVCGHDPMCATRHACIDRTLAEARADRERKSG